MEIDLTSKAGIQKFVVTLIGMVGTILISMFGWSPDKTNTLVTILTEFSPLIAAILFYVVNQLAARGKANATVKIIEAQSQAKVAEIIATKGVNNVVSQ